VTDPSDHIRKLAAIMFTDIVGYSALTQRDETLALELLEEHRQLLRPLFDQYHGNEIKTIGDAFLVEFASAVEATRCAIDMQTILTSHTSVVKPERRMQVRIGLHVGDVVMKEGDVLGDGVNIAARIEPLAPPGGICVSEDVARQIDNKIELPLERLAAKELKNIKTPVAVYRIVLPWEKKAGLLLRVRRSLRKPFSARLARTGVMALLIAAAAGWWWKSHSVPTIQPGQITHLAVLPFANLMSDPDQEYFVDGFHDALLTELSKLRTMTVISRQSVIRYKGSDKSLPEIASELQAHALIEGSVLRAGDDVRINVQLIEAAADRHLWAGVFDRKLGNVLALHSDVVRAIAGQVKVTLSPEQESRLANTRMVNPETYEAYLKGMFHMSKYTKEGFEKGLAYLNEALENDPDDPLAYAGLALAYVQIAHSPEPTPDALVRARALALKALELDDTLAEAHAALAEVRLYLEHDWAGAKQEFRRALELNPSLAKTRGHHAWYLALMGHQAETIEEIERAQEFHPLSPLMSAWRGWQHWWFGQHEEAISAVQRSLELRPNFTVGLYVLGTVYAQQGRFEEAIAAHRKLAELSRKWAWALGHTLALVGRKDEARLILAQMKGRGSTNHWGMAEIHTALGERDEAFRLLERAREFPHVWIAWAEWNPHFEPLRSDPRFENLVRRLALPD